MLGKQNEKVLPVKPMALKKLTVSFTEILPGCAQQCTKTVSVLAAIVNLIRSNITVLVSVPRPIGVSEINSLTWLSVL